MTACGLVVRDRGADRQHAGIEIDGLHRPPRCHRRRRASRAPRATAATTPHRRAPKRQAGVRRRSGVIATLIGPPATIAVCTAGRSSTTSLPGARSTGLATAGGASARGQAREQRVDLASHLGGVHRSDRDQDKAFAHQDVAPPRLDVGERDLRVDRRHRRRDSADRVRPRSAAGTRAAAPSSRHCPRLAGSRSSRSSSIRQGARWASPGRSARARTAARRRRTLPAAPSVGPAPDSPARRGSPLPAGRETLRSWRCGSSRAVLP